MTRALWIASLVLAAYAQAPARFVGTVQAVRAGEVDVKPDQGDLLTTKLIPETIFQRVEPGEKDLKQAKVIQLTDVAVGDRVLVALEPGTQDLRRLVVMPASEIARRNEAERLDWQKRGVTGVVADRKGNEIMLKMRSLMGETQAVVTVAEKTAYRRYAPDSVKFSDAKTSSLADVGIGDQLRARGVKSEDGLKVTADEVVFGTFVTKAGKIASVDVAAKQIKVLESGTNKPLLINIAEDSQIKKMPNFPAMGGGMPGRSMPGPMPGGTGAPMGGMRAPDMSQMLERMPSSKLEDLKTGETIVVSSTRGATAGEITAITLLANADMLLQMASMQNSARRAQQGAAGGMGAMGGSGSGMMGGMTGGLEGMQLPGIMP